MQALEESRGVRDVAEAALEATGQRVRQRVVASEVMVHEDLSRSTRYWPRCVGSAEDGVQQRVVQQGVVSDGKVHSAAGLLDGQVRFHDGQRITAPPAMAECRTTADSFKSIMSTPVLGEACDDGRPLVTEITAPPKMAKCRATPDKSIVPYPPMLVLGEAMQAERGMNTFDQEEVDVAIARAAALRLAHQHPECAVSGPDGSPHDTSPPSPCVMQ